MDVIRLTKHEDITLLQNDELYWLCCIKGTPKSFLRLINTPHQKDEQRKWRWLLNSIVLLNGGKWLSLKLRPSYHLGWYVPLKARLYKLHRCPEGKVAAIVSNGTVTAQPAVGNVAKLRNRKQKTLIQWTLGLRPAWHTNNSLGYNQNFSFDLRPNLELRPAWRS
jgi:hypothetical protein